MMAVTRANDDRDTVPSPLPKTVLLRHSLPDGTWHFDWLIDRGNGEKLLAFRVQERPDTAGTDRFDAQRCADHRREYLEYEGPVSGGRGEVTRVASGVVERLSETNDELRVEADFQGVRRVWCGRSLGGASPQAWHFEAVKT